MRPFHQCRLWLRRAPLPERVAAFMGVALVAVVFGWLLVPPGGSGTPVESVGVSGGSGPVGAGPNAAGGTAGTSGPGPTSVAGAGSGSGTTGALSGPGGSPAANPAGSPAAGTGPATPGQAATHAGCVSPPGSDHGVSASQIKIAILLVNVAGAASTTVGGYPTPA